MLLSFKPPHLKLFFLLTLFFPQPSISGQTIPVSGETWEPAELKKITAEAQRHLSSAQPDSALLLLRAPLQYLRQNEQLNTPLGLEIQYIHAQSLEVDQQDSLALEALLQLKEVSWNLENWTIYAKTCLVLANLHEKLGRAQQSKDNLEDARSVLDRNGMDTVYTIFAIRMSSWQRIFGRRDSSLHYAQLALTYARKVRNLSGEAQAHLLLGALSAQENYLEAIEHYKEAARLCERINDYLGQTYYNNGIASLYLRNDQPEKALTYNTEGLRGVRNAAKVGYEENWVGHRAYQLRGEIYQALGRIDSSYFYARKGLQMELDNLRDSQQKEVAEIDAKYTDEKKSLQLAQQQQKIHQGRQTRYLLTGIIFLVLLIALVLVYSYQTQRRINKKVKEQAEQLQALDRMKSRFFANVSHELRTPLTLILGPVRSLLKNDYPPAKQKKLLQLASHSGHQLEQLVNEILDLQKLSAGKLQLWAQATPLHRFFQSKLTQFESLAVYKGIDFSYHLELSEQQSAAIDREKCRQILYNLLSNAFKFTPRGGKVSAIISGQDQRLILQVKDTGRGIPAKDLPHIFDRYFQSSKPDGSAEGGTGIGLAICKEYAELMGGKIEVKSRVDVGTSFTVILPLRPAETATVGEEDARLAPPVREEQAISDIPAAGSLPAAAQGVGKPHLLLVEDNAQVQAYLHTVLSDQYQLTAAQNGQEALQLLAGSTNFQLIISDLMMPVMDGFQFLEKVKSSDAVRHLPFIMLTARAAAQDKLNALRIGVDDYLLKPFDEEELKTRIENLLRHQAARYPEVSAASPSMDATPVMSEADREWLVSFEQCVRKHIASDLLSVSMLADEYAMSESTLLRQLKRLTGLSPLQYLTEVRLHEARRLLENGTYRSVSQVASAVGYADARSLTRRFKKRFGKLPSDIRGVEN